MKLFMTDEQKAWKAVDILRSIGGDPGTDVMIHLEEDYLRLHIKKMGKTVFKVKLNMMKLTEQAHDELSYVIFDRIF